LDPLIRREMQDEFLRLQKMLRKTIVFITHDFDEAIRLADHIAIMKDGTVEQIGTPEDLVTRPATDYVAEFTSQVSRAKVLTVRTIMSSLGDGPRDFAGEFSPAVTIADAAPQLHEADRPFAVVDEKGQLLGQVTKEDVIDVLMG
jgi:glycine betaine/proline transport system ATP-binding protein